ncbi:MAG: acyl-CoA thioesterase [Bacteroidaceae bacterium]|nr:acyl-CoA thioesterase [Bacteroidaceae bacterium]
MKEYLFTVQLETRDYECDLQGVINNANYQHYLEYTRHKWLQSRGQSFRQWHEEGIDVMLSEINMKYKAPLHGQEEFLSCLNLHREGARFIFEQDLYRKADLKMCLQATVTVISVVNGHLSKGDEVAMKIGLHP